MARSTELKGVYNLNPTRQVMKQGGREDRQLHEKHEADYKGPNKSMEAHEVASDSGHENRSHDMGHPAMATRASNPKERKHIDGRKHEDHHHAVRKLKGN